MRVQVLFGKEMQFFAAVVAGVGGGLLQTHCEELNWCQTGGGKAGTGRGGQEEVLTVWIESRKIVEVQDRAMALLWLTNLCVVRVDILF